MASLLDHAKFCVVAYEVENLPLNTDVGSYKSDNLNFQLPSGWKLTKTPGIPNDQPTLNGNESNFAAGIFRNAESNTTLFAFRGTQFSQMADHDANIDNTFGDGASRQAEQAYQEVVQYMKDNPGENIELTGHSEGGYEAQYVTARLAIDCPDLMKDGRVSCSTVNAWERGRLGRRVVVNPKYEDSAFGQMSWN